MQHEQLLSLITSSDLTIMYAYPHQRRYGISMCINGRYQNDVLAFSREELQALTTLEAQKMIDASKADMLRASKTKSGILSDSEEVKQAKKEKRKTAVNSVKKKESETEKYLRQMRTRGNKLAKSVKYG